MKTPMPQQNSNSNSDSKRNATLNPDRNLFSRMFRSVVEWFRPSHRIPIEQTISPEQFQKMLAQTLADPELKLLLLKSMAGTVWPIQGAA